VIVLGIDPGTATTGYGVVRRDERGPTLLECGVIRTTSSQAHSVRLREIYDGVTEVIRRFAPTAVVVEDVFFAKNVRTTVVLGQARGVILLAAEQAGIAVHEYQPTEIKKAVVGRGAASKEQVQFMVTRLLRLARAPEPADAADGVAAALAHVMGGRLESLPAFR